MGSLMENKAGFLFVMLMICERVVKDCRREEEKGGKVTKNSLDRKVKKVYNIKVKM